MLTYRDGAVTDGLGFVDFNGDFIIGNNKILRNGSTDTLDLVNVMPIAPIFNTYVFRWSNSYIKIVDDNDNDYIATPNNIELWDNLWAGTLGVQSVLNGESFVINQSNPNTTDLYMADQSGNLYRYTKQNLFDHATAPFLLPGAPNLSVTNPNLTQWVTRCQEGFFVSTYNGKIILYDYNGNEINTIGDDNDYIGKIVTIDYDMEFFYYVDEDKRRIIKERVPF